METTLSGRAKDYSFVTDGERGDERAHTLTKGKKKKRHTHTHTHTHTHICAHGPEVTVSHLTATLWLLSESSSTDAASVPPRLHKLKP